MNPRRVAVYTVIWLVLSAYYFAFEYTYEELPAETKPAPTLGLEATAITEITFSRGDLVVRCLRAEAGWKCVEPPDALIPADLITGLLNALLDTPPVEIIDDPGTALADFGLMQPAGTVDLVLRGAERVRIRLGTRNPAQTAVYTQIEHKPVVLLLGLNVEYYFGLLMESAARPRRP